MNCDLVKKYLKKLFVLVIFAAVFSTISVVWHHFDKVQSRAEKFLASNSDIQEQLGSNLTYSRLRILFINATEKQQAYREYHYLVEGDRKKRARVIIRVDQLKQSEEKEQYSIAEIRPIDD